ncbi:protein ABSCISIC ACID-INSENSITIVE 5-like [Silene latifolia]|uniref:protein ABSCISIC ACID-INSENSITIVE 5-like n=1 Tax=Silene latifolia TaxID=37657 RepID=UPI003D787C34
MGQSEVNSSGMPPGMDDQNPKIDLGDNQNNQNSQNALGRQSTIYSLTLDEFQHTLCENGKNFGSMNMDEFLSSIWSAEENHHHGQHHDNSKPTIAKQPSLTRQGSLTLPAPLCSKTVDEVWSEIQRTQHPIQHHIHAETENTNSTERQATFGEMTLEDFLVKAGVVREQCGPVPGPPVQQHPPQYGFMGMPAGGYQPSTGADTCGFIGNGKRNNGYPVAATPISCYAGRVNTNGAPVSPVSPDGLCGTGQVENPAAHYGLDMASLRGRKRNIDGPVEKVVERRQRRMIKNRESAARSRARKQAYTVELEAELNQLREENAQLKQGLAEIERQRKQQYREEQKQVAATASRVERALQKFKALRRTRSCRFTDDKF